jgi:hypothetical protein
MVDTLAETVDARQKKPYHLKHVAGNFIAFQTNASIEYLLTQQYAFRITCSKAITNIQAAVLYFTNKAFMRFLREIHQINPQYFSPAYFFSKYLEDIFGICNFRGLHHKLSAECSFRLI